MAKEETIKVISLYPHAMRFTEAMQWVVNAGINKMPGFVCFANVHMTVEACKDPLFAQQLRTASLVFFNNSEAGCRLFTTGILIK